MDHTSWQLERFQSEVGRPAVIWDDRAFTYGDILAHYEKWDYWLDAAGGRPGGSVALIVDYSPAAVAGLLALVARRCLLVPLSRDSRDQHKEFFCIAEIDYRIEL